MPGTACNIFIFPIHFDFPEVMLLINLTSAIDHSLTSDDGLSSSSSSSSSSLLTTFATPGSTERLREVNWYLVIVILSVLVLVGLCFTVCRLMLKATAHEKAGLGDWRRDSLLYSRKDSIIPISLHLDQNDDYSS